MAALHVGYKRRLSIRAILGGGKFLKQSYQKKQAVFCHNARCEGIYEFRTTKPSKIKAHLTDVIFCRPVPDPPAPEQC